MRASPNPQGDGQRGTSRRSLSNLVMECTPPNTIQKRKGGGMRRKGHKIQVHLRHEPLRYRCAPRPYYLRPTKKGRGRKKRLQTKKNNSARLKSGRRVRGVLCLLKSNRDHLGGHSCIKAPLRASKRTEKTHQKTS